MSISEINLAGRISHFFATNRALSALLLIVSLVFGLGSFFLTPKQYNPEIVRPAFAVSVQYEGATIEGAIDRVVYELVEKINTVPGVDDVYTEVHDGATIQSTVIFEVGYDASRAKLDLLTQLDQHSYLARGNIHTPQIIEINPETIPVLQIVFGSGELSIAELREKVIALSHELGSVADVSELHVYGGYAPALVVEVDPNLLVANHVSVDQLTETLVQGQTRTVSSGLRNEQYALEIVFDGRAVSAEEVGDLVVQNGIKVRDVARVYEGTGDVRSYIFHHSKEVSGEVVLLSVAKVEGSSAPVVTEELLKELDSVLLHPSYEKLEYKVVSNDGETANTEIFGLTKNLITSVMIVAVVLLLFLSLRAAAVVLIAIPVTVLVVFGLGYVFDQTINRITLFALILSLGLLVDAAIVAVENIYSRIKEWQQNPTDETREQVIATAVDEVGVGLLLSTITSVIVFLPMNFITGMMGPYMGPIAFFVPAALIISFLVAIVVTPFVAGHVLRGEDTQNILTRTFSYFMQKVTRMYSRTLQSILQHRKKQQLILWSAIGIFFLTLLLPLTGLVHFQMLPRADRDQVYVYVDLPVGTDRETTRNITREISDVILSHESVVDLQEFVATPPIVDFNGMFKGAQNRSESYMATLRVNLVPAHERQQSSTDITSAMRQSVENTLPETGRFVRFIEEPPGPPVRATFVAKVFTEDSTVQREAADALRGLVSSVAGVVDEYQSDKTPVGRVRYEFDRVSAEALGVSADSVSTVLAVLGSSYEVTEFLGSDAVEYAPITLALPATYEVSPEFIDTVTVTSSSGEAVPLRAVLSVVHEMRPAAVYFEEAESLSYVTAEVQDRSIVYVVIELMKRINRDELEGYKVLDWNLWGMKIEAADGARVNLVWGGEWEMTLENFRDLGIAMGVALLMVYLLLVAQYNTFRAPAYILVTVPLGLVGILWGFFFLDWGFDIYLTATALIGFIALIGIVVNNAIIYLEYVEQAKAAGATYEEALVVAGEARLRPIFLTSLTTILGSLTIAADPVWSGLAWAIVFGLSLSTLLTLIIYPTLLARFSPESGN